MRPVLTYQLVEIIPKSEKSVDCGAKNLTQAAHPSPSKKRRCP